MLYPGVEVVSEEIILCLPFDYFHIFESIPYGVSLSCVPELSRIRDHSNRYLTCLPPILNNYNKVHQRSLVPRPFPCTSII